MSCGQDDTKVYSVGTANSTLRVVMSRSRPPSKPDWLEGRTRVAHYYIVRSLMRRPWTRFVDERFRIGWLLTDTVGHGADAENFSQRPVCAMPAREPPSSRDRPSKQPVA